MFDFFITINAINNCYHLITCIIRAFVQIRNIVCIVYIRRNNCTFRKYFALLNLRERVSIKSVAAKIRWAEILMRVAYPNKQNIFPKWNFPRTTFWNHKFLHKYKKLDRQHDLKPLIAFFLRICRKSLFLFSNNRTLRSDL